MWRAPFQIGITLEISENPRNGYNWKALVGVSSCPAAQQSCVFCPPPRPAGPAARRSARSRAHFAHSAPRPRPRPAGRAARCHHPPAVEFLLPGGRGNLEEVSSTAGGTKMQRKMQRGQRQKIRKRTRANARVLKLSRVPKEKNYTKYPQKMVIGKYTKR